MKRINYYTISKSDVMKLAWKWFREYANYTASKFVEGVGYVREKMDKTFSECLKMAWSFYKCKAVEANKQADRLNKFIDNNKHKGGIYA